MRRFAFGTILGATALALVFVAAPASAQGGEVIDGCLSPTDSVAAFLEVYGDPVGETTKDCKKNCRESEKGCKDVAKNNEKCNQDAGKAVSKIAKNNCGKDKSCKDAVKDTEKELKDALKADKKNAEGLCRAAKNDCYEACGDL